MNAITEAVRRARQAIIQLSEYEYVAYVQACAALREIEAMADELDGKSGAMHRVIGKTLELDKALAASAPATRSGYYTWEHDTLPARVARPEDADFARGDPRWVRGFPVEVYAADLALSAVDDGQARDQAESDALLYGTGFLVDGRRVDPSRVSMLTSPLAAPAPDAGAVGVARKRCRDLLSAYGAGIPSWQHEEISSAIDQLIALASALQSAPDAGDENANRYRVEKWGAFGWCVKCGDGTRNLFVGRRDACEHVAAELLTAFRDGEFLAAPPQPAEKAPRASLSPQEVEVLVKRWWTAGANPETLVAWTLQAVSCKPQPAEKADAWLYECRKPGTFLRYASLDGSGSEHWPVDQWDSIIKMPLEVRGVTAEKAVEAECASSVRDALAELVACKNLREKIDAFDQDVPATVRAPLIEEYNRRKPAAWSTARAALASAPQADQAGELTDVQLDALAWQWVSEKLTLSCDAHGNPVNGYRITEFRMRMFARAAIAADRAARYQLEEEEIHQLSELVQTLDAKCAELEQLQAAIVRQPGGEVRKPLTYDEGNAS